jgi:hypothetical protein
MGSDVPRVKRERVPADEPRIEWRPKMYHIQKRFLTILGLCVVGAACEGPLSSPTAPSTSPASLSASTRRSGDLVFTKDCTGTWAGQAGGYCTITESNVEQIKVGSTVVYQQAAGLTSLDSDVIIHAPLSGKKVAAHGKRVASGHCELAFDTFLGHCEFSGEQGQLKGFQASVDVTCVGAVCGLEGTYAFSRRD